MSEPDDDVESRPIPEEWFCHWQEAWVGRCKKEAALKSWFCDEHRVKVCASCGKPAVRSCELTGIQFVCGAPLCADCEHGDPPPDSLFNLGGGHRARVAAADLVRGKGDFLSGCMVAVSVKPILRLIRRTLTGV